MVSLITLDDMMSVICWVTTTADVLYLRAVFHSPVRNGAMVSFAMAFHASSMTITFIPSCERILALTEFMMQRMQSE